MLFFCRVCIWRLYNVHVSEQYSEAGMQTAVYTPANASTLKLLLEKNKNDLLKAMEAGLILQLISRFIEQYDLRMFLRYMKCFSWFPSDVGVERRL